MEMKTDREIFIADFLALEDLVSDLYTNARFHLDEAMNWPAGSPDRDVCMELAAYYQNAAGRISAGVLWRRLAVV